MEVHEARWDLVDSGEEPLSLRPGDKVVDALDVADLESEALHAFDQSGSYPTWTVASLLHDGEREYADGGRTHRSLDRFELQLPRGGGALLARVGAPERALRLGAFVEGRALGSVELEQGQTEELRFSLPADLEGRRKVELRAQGAGEFSAYHCWSVAQEP